MTDIALVEKHYSDGKTELVETDTFCVNGIQSCTMQASVALLIETVYDLPRDTTLRALIKSGVEVVYYTCFVPLGLMDNATMGHHPLLDVDWSVE